MAADIIALLDHLKLEPVILVGHSMGGYIAGTLAATVPNRIKGLAVLDKSAAGPEKQNPNPPEKILAVDPVTKEWPLSFSSLKEAQEFIRNAMDSDLSYQYFMNSLVEELDGYRLMFSRQAMANNIAYYQQWFDLLPGIKCPVLLVRSSSHEGVNDEDWKRMQALLSDCMAFEMSHPDHNVYLSNKREFYESFDTFLNMVENR